MNQNAQWNSDICIYNFCNADRPLLLTLQTFGPEIYALPQTAVKM